MVKFKLFYFTKNLIINYENKCIQRYKFKNISLNNNYTYKILVLLILSFHFIINPNHFLYNSNEFFLKSTKKINIINEFNNMYSNLYFLTNKRTIIPYYNRKIYSNKAKKILLCTIGKNENLYAKEFVEYYYILGFDKILIFDNNDFDGEKFDDILNDYISKKIVEIIDIRGLKSIQMPAYNYCYKKNINLYEWIAFFDFDEFLYIKNYDNIKIYLSNNRFSKCQSILFNWHIYNDNNLIKYDKRTMIERFKSCKFITGTNKFIVRGNIKKLLITTAHIAINTNYCNSKGDLIYRKNYKMLPKENNSIAFIKHFYTKTAEEFCNKILRGDVQFSVNKTFSYQITKFFRYNKKNINKIKILEKCFKIKY